MTVEFYKNVYQDFKSRILGNKKALKRSQIGWRQILVTDHPSRNKVLVIALKNYTEADFKVS